jgi:hypothetical protein
VSESQPAVSVDVALPAIGANPAKT